MHEKRKNRACDVQNDRAKQSAPRPKLKRKEYEQEIAKLHAELVKLQLWVKHTGARIVVVFEGKDAAGKGGVIKWITDSRISSSRTPGSFRAGALADLLSTVFPTFAGSG